VDVVLVEPTLRLERLVQAHQREIWRYLRFLGASPSEADDLTQETFLEVWRRPFEERGERSTQAYLRRVAKNRFLMVVRRKGRRPAVVDLEAAEGEWARHAGEDGGDARVDALAACLETLKEQARRALDLLYAEKKSRAEVAEQVGLELEGLKTLVRRAKVKLRECVERRVRREEGP
jgi:RNA polymerase sigma-70 factor (ECF subfamily)